ncbi:MAG: holo-ACP synthase [Alphaproteobacteria bacterium]|nr:holo-ACP synthase [Alphaproteobacteria bacterium]TAD92001.1 MAG: holo-ACP synthase [Alphaproteobacteria bacterium]
MIIGLGTDLCAIPRIEKVLNRFGDRFLARVFTQTERAKALRRPTPAPTLAKRFAAKEACAKALGTGFREGVFHRDMGVVTLPGGKPSLVLTGGAAERLARITPPGHRAVIDLTLTDEPPLAHAIVIIQAIPA